MTDDGSGRAADATYGYGYDDLLRVGVPDVPEGFEAFWRAAYARATQIPPNVARRRTQYADAGVEVWEVEFDSWDGVRIGGWMTIRSGILPTQVARAMVVGHGYGGREGPELAVPAQPDVVLFPCARGFHRSAHPHIPGDAFGHVVHGIDAPDTYSHLGSCADLIWCAANAVQAMFPKVANLWFRGASFGGGIGALGLPWDDRYDRAQLGVPSFGNHALRLTMPCTGSGEAVRRLYQTRPQIAQTLAFFDAAVAARFLTIPTLVELALQDPAVPPPGQFSVYNAIPAPKQVFVRQAGHMDHPANHDDDARLNQMVAEWFQA